MEVIFYSSGRLKFCHHIFQFSTTNDGVINEKEAKEYSSSKCKIEMLSL